MRKRICALVSVLFLLGIVFIACKNDDDSPKGKPGLISSDISSCKNDPNNETYETRADIIDEGMIHYLEYEVDGDGQLHLKDVNHWVPCSMTAFDVDAVVKGDSIIVTEKNNSGDVVSTCTCPIDVDLVIGPLETKTYTLVYDRDGLVPSKYSLTAASGQKGTFEVEDVAMPRFDMEVDGIYYNIKSSQTVEVTTYPYYGEKDFEGYKGEIIIPEQITHDGKTYTVTTIDHYAFWRSNITSVYIPNTVKELGLMIFGGCQNLASVHLSENLTYIPNTTFDGCTSLTEITIPDGIKDVFSFAFSYCSSLKTVTLPKELRVLGNDVFTGCNNLREIYVRSNEVPQIDSYAFDTEVLQLATLYVPKGCKEAYSTAEYWKDFAHIEEYEYE